MGPVILSICISCQLILSVVGVGFTQIGLKDCSLVKNCFVSSAACAPETCEYVATWKTIRTAGKDYLEVELAGVVGTATATGGYIAMGFSYDRRMGDDGVVGCYMDINRGGVIQFAAGYNEIQGKSNKWLDPKDLDDNFLVTSSGDGWLGGYYDGQSKRIQCRFRRLIKPVRNVRYLKDLSTDAYYILIARGLAVSHNSFDKHFAGGSTSSLTKHVMKNVYPGGIFASSGVDSPIAKTHGCLMVLSWVFCASVGIIMARYYKDMWPNSGVVGERIWFQSHRILQSCCVILTTIGFILIFIYVNGYSSIEVWPLKAHPILGIIVFILAFINPLIALCRPVPTHKNRPVFNWIHFFVGTIAYVLSVPTMMLGFRMSGAGVLLATLDAPLWLLIFFVLFQVAVELILEIHGCMYYRKNKDKRHNYELELDEYAARVKVAGPQPRPREPEPSGRMFKYFMIGLHATVSAIVAVVLVIIIAVY